MIQYKTDEYNPTIAIHPGLTLSETLESIGMTQVEFAQRTSRPEKTISEIINGTTAITPETAIQFERVLSIPASFWNNLEKNYQELQAKLNAKATLKTDIALAENYPYSAMAKLGWVNLTKTWEEKVENLLLFFGVDKLSLVDKVMPAAFRQHNGRSISKYSIQAWLRKGELDSRAIETKPFNKDELVSHMSSIKRYSTQSPQRFIAELQEMLAGFGIALVFTPDLPKTYVCGAARWITPQKAMVQLSLRGSYADIMWFTLYHELGHLLLHSKKEYFVDVFISNGSEEEKEANDFASEQLIPQEKLSRFLSNKEVKPSSIKEFANELGVHPGIVIGRLQHDKVLEWKELSNLRTRYRFINT